MDAFTTYLAKIRQRELLDAARAASDGAAARRARRAARPPPARRPIHARMGRHADGVPALPPPPS